jgi:hypothetical protein
LLGDFCLDFDLDLDLERVFCFLGVYLYINEKLRSERGLFFFVTLDLEALLLRLLLLAINFFILVLSKVSLLTGDFTLSLDWIDIKSILLSFRFTDYLFVVVSLDFLVADRFFPFTFLDLVLDRLDLRDSLDSRELTEHLVDRADNCCLCLRALFSAICFSMASSRFFFICS